MVSIDNKTDMILDMDKELEEFYQRYEEHKNKKKLLLEFSESRKDYSSPEFKLSKPKFKKKLKGRVFSKNDNNKQGLF